MTEEQKKRSSDYLHLMLGLCEKARYDTSIISETWGATIMAECVGMITKPSMDRILRYLDKREKQIREPYEHQH